MEPDPVRSCPSDRPRWRALATLAVFGATTGLCLAAAPSDNAPPNASWASSRSTTDLDVFLRTVQRVHNGEGYYDAAGRELRAHGYPIRSMFNWRPPLYAWLYGAQPSPAWGQAILVLLASVTLLLSCDLALREGGMTLAAANGLLLIGALGWCVSPNNTLSTELRAGTMITLSVVTYARDWWLLGVAAGLFSL
ncbi:MAG TPA: hypothetical protein VKP69_33255, partial [Isosphaeraceae bacterium]|nr:hypothetical protein [Isosphaeraceae bacterium]